MTHICIDSNSESGQKINPCKGVWIFLSTSFPWLFLVLSRGQSSKVLWNPPPEKRSLKKCIFLAGKSVYLQASKCGLQITKLCSQWFLQLGQTNFVDKLLKEYQEELKALLAEVQLTARISLQAALDTSDKAVHTIARRRLLWLQSAGIPRKAQATTRASHFRATTSSAVVLMRHIIPWKIPGQLCIPWGTLPTPKKKADNTTAIFQVLWSAIEDLPSHWGRGRYFTGGNSLLPPESGALNGHHIWHQHWEFGWQITGSFFVLPWQLSSIFKKLGV